MSEKENVVSEKSWVDIELKRLDIEFNKWKLDYVTKMELETEKEKCKWETIEKILIPVLTQTQSFLNRIEFSTKSEVNKPANYAATSFLCPKCEENKIHTIIDVKDKPDVAKCPICKAEYPRLH